MKIILKNESIENLDTKLEQTIGSVLEKSGAMGATYTVDAEILVNIKLAGSDVEQHIFTDRDIFGKPEIFTVIPEFDERGTLIGSEDNTESTFEAIAEALAQGLPTEAVDSHFVDEDLTEVSKEVSGDLSEVVYDHKDGFKVIRYYREGVGLVGELEAKAAGEE